MDLLSGIRILSFNHFFMGPAGIQYLADLGADVISVEPIGGADRAEVALTDFDRDGELKVVAAALYASSCSRAATTGRGRSGA